jgi:UDP-glucose 4-epimerase
MRAVTTGGGGFVMANFLRHWLEADQAHVATAVDVAPFDAASLRFLAPVRDRLQVVVGDVARAELWQSLPRDTAYVIHGAAVTPHAFTDEHGLRREPERERPVAVIETNVLGTARALDWARSLPHLRRFVFVSTGSVYAEEVPRQRQAPFALPEEGYIGPRGLYDITKYSSELMTRRFAELYGFSAVCVRLSNVFGPLDRRTPARNVRNPVNIIATAAAQGGRVTVRNPEVPGDYIYAPDVARALGLLLQAPRNALAHGMYNIAYGAPALVRDLLRIAAEAAPNFSFSTVRDGTAMIDLDLDRSTGRWGPYDISRAQRDLGWTPRPLREAIHQYIDWLRSAEGSC